MAECQRAAAQTWHEHELRVRLVALHQAGSHECLEMASESQKLLLMVGVAVEGYLLAAELTERLILPVIDVRVGQEDGMDSAPRGTDRMESGRQPTRPKPSIQQDPESAELQQAGIAAAAAGKHRKT